MKTANITPIYKGGDKCLAKNYRPIALTSHIMKIFEKVLKKFIVSHIERNGLFNDTQHGFRAGRSCLSQLLDHHESILKELEQDQMVNTPGMKSPGPRL